MIERAIGGDERARAGGRLDDDGDARQTADEPVAAGKRVGVRPLAGRQLRDEAAVRDHALVQRPVRRGVDDAETVAQDAQRRTARVQGGSVRDGVDASCHAAHDHDAGLCHTLGQDPRRRRPVGGVVATAHHAGRRPREQIHVAPRVQERRRLRNVAQRLWEAGIVGEEHGRPQAIELRQLLAPGVERRGAHRRGRGSAEAGERRDGAVRCLQRRRRRLEGGRERAEPDGTDAGQLRERQVGG